MALSLAARNAARLAAELYALTHRGNPGDAAFYAELCASADGVLELGAGYGRILWALARARARVVGLELDPALLALARRNLRDLPLAQRGSLQLLPGDMRDFELAARFERVLLPYNGLYCLLTRRQALSCFRAVRRVLAPGGVFALDVWNAAPFQRQTAVRSSQADAEPLVSLRHARRPWDVFERSRVRRASQRLAVSYRYVPREGGAPIPISIAQRYYLSAELAQLLARAGFEIEKRFGDFSGARFSAHSPQLILLARAI